MSSLARRIGFRSLALGLGLVIALGALELGMRIAGVEVAGTAEGTDRDDAWRRCFEASATRGWTPRPGTCGRNERGMSGGPFAEERGDRIRLLVTGDSVACQGKWVDAARIALEARLRREVEVILACASGYDTCQELDWLLEVGNVYRPDLIVLQTCPNDLRPSPVVLPIGTSWVRIYRGDSTITIPRALLRLRLVRYLALRGSGDADAEPDAVAQIAACMAGFEQVAAEWGVPVVVVGFPLLATDRDGLERAPLRRSETSMERIVARAALPALSLRAPLMKRASPDAPDPMYSWRRRPSDAIHPNLAAQLAIAPVVADFLAEQLVGRETPRK